MPSPFFKAPIKQPRDASLTAKQIEWIDEMMIEAKKMGEEVGREMTKEHTERYQTTLLEAAKAYNATHENHAAMNSKDWKSDIILEHFKVVADHIEEHLKHSHTPS